MPEVAELAAVAQRHIYIRVEGIPAPQGSKKYVGHSHANHAILLESSKKVKPWRAAVKAAAELAEEREYAFLPLEGPLTVTMTFYMPRGKTVKRQYPTTYPDISKLIRSTEDALTEAKVWKDDAQVVFYGNTSKQYASAEHPAGALIHVETMQ